MERHKDSLTIGDIVNPPRVTFLPFRFYNRDTSRRVIRVYFIASSIDDCSSDHKIARGEVRFIDTSIHTSRFIVQINRLDESKRFELRVQFRNIIVILFSLSLSLSLSNFSFLLYFTYHGTRVE